MADEMVVRESHELATQETLTLDQLVDQVQLIQHTMKRVMQDGVHYGVIPGTDKPTLYKPGAEKLCLLFRLDPQYTIYDHYDDVHYTVRATCTLYHSPTGNRMGSGEGLCSTKEKKYGIRAAQRVCPICGASAIIKGKKEYGGGWLCWKKKDGCGATFSDDDLLITAQVTDDVVNPDIADTYNTVLKMACKRALVAGVLNVTAASDIFTQDMEDVATPAPPKPSLASDETVEALAAALLDNGDADELWGASVVLANASRKFGRQIDRLNELYEAEAQQVLAGAIAWRNQNPLTVVDPDEIEFGDE